MGIHEAYRASLREWCETMDESRRRTEDGRRDTAVDIASEVGRQLAPIIQEFRAAMRGTSSEEATHWRSYEKWTRNGKRESWKTWKGGWETMKWVLRLNRGEGTFFGKVDVGRVWCWVNRQEAFLYQQNWTWTRTSSKGLRILFFTIGGKNLFKSSQK